MHKEIKWAEDREKRRIKKALKVAKHRPFKNFLIWFVGFLSCIILLAGSAFLVLKLIPLKSILGSENEYVSEEVAEDSLFDAIFKFDQYQFKDVPILFTVIDDAMKNAGIDEFIKINFDGLKEVSFTSPDLMTEIGENIEVIATIESLGGVELLGDFGKISAFTDVEEVLAEDYPDEVSKTFNAKLYYYYDGDEYVRAFTDEHERVEGAEDKKLYYPALKDVKILECVDIISERLGESTVGSLLSVFAVMDEDDIVMKIVGNKKIKDMGEISPDTILLSDVMEYSESETLFHIILDIKGESDYSKYDTITLGDVMSLDTNKIKLSTVMGEDIDETLASVLVDATRRDSFDLITVGDLTNFNMDSVKLSSVLPYQIDNNNDGIFNSEEGDVDNSALYELILGLKNQDNTEENRDALTLSSVKGLQVNDIKLTTVLPVNSGNETLYKILSDVSGETNYENITVGDLADFNMESIRLNSVLPKSENEALYKILLDVTKETNPENLTLASIKGLDTSAIHLATVLDPDENEVIFNILKEATKKDNPTIAELSSFEIKNVHLVNILPYEDKENGIDNSDIYSLLCDATDTENYKDLTVDKLSGFKHELIYLTSVLPYDATNMDIYRILVDATGVSDYTELRLSHLTSFKKEDIKLSSVISIEDGKTGNAILDKLLEDEDDPTTLGNFATKLNNLTFLEVYPEASECFSTEKEDGNCSRPYYKTVDGDYYLKSYIDDTNSVFKDTDGLTKIILQDGSIVAVVEGEYFVKKNAMIYFLYIFEDESAGEDGTERLDFHDGGHAIRWVHREIKINDLSKFSDAVSHMKNATIRMLEDTGVIDHREFFDSKGWYSLTLDGVMEEIANMLETIS